MKKLSTVLSMVVAGTFLWTFGRVADVSAASDEQGGSTLGWTFDRLARQSLSYPSIQAKKGLEKAAEAEVKAAVWERLPTAGIQFSSRDAFDGSGLNQDGIENTESAIFSLEQPLWTGGRITAGWEGAKARHRFSAEDTRTTEQYVLLDVASAYTEALRRQSHWNIHSDNVKHHKQLQAMIERRAAQKISPEVDQALAKSRLHQTVSDLSHAGELLNNALSRLTELTGEIVEGIEPYTNTKKGEDAATIGNLKKTIALAVASSPVLSGLSFKEKAAKADIQVAKSVWWPTVSLKAEKTTGVSSTGTADTERLFLFATTQFGAGLSDWSRVDAVTAKRDSVAFEYDSAMRDLTVRVTEAWNKHDAARIRLENAKSSSEAAQAVYESYSRQFGIGQKSWLDVLNAIRESAMSRLNVEDAKAEMLASELELMILTGLLNVK